mgnify:CR=1 FL=1
MNCINKRIIKTYTCLVLTLIIFLASFPTTIFANNNTTESHFKKTKNYTSTTYKDVPSNAWYYPSVKLAYEYELLVGSNGLFNPQEEMNLAQVITCAARLNAKYFNREAELNKLITNNKKGSAWYKPYLTYASKYNILLKTDNVTYLETPASREELAYYLAKSVPANNFTKIRNADIPDYYSINPKYQSSVRMLVDAGIIAGGDIYGTYHPHDSALRAAVATILVRIASPVERVTTETTKLPDSAPGISRLDKEYSTYLPLFPIGKYKGKVYYYPLTGDHKSLMRCNEDGTNQEVVLMGNEEARYLEDIELLDIINDEVFIRYNLSVYKTDLKFTKKEFLTTDIAIRTADPVIVGNRLFFHEGRSDLYCQFVSIDLSGENKVVYYSNEAVFEVVDQWVYLKDTDFSKKKISPIYKINIDGSGLTEVTDSCLYPFTRGPAFIIKDDWVYFLHGEHKQFYRANVNTKEEQRLSEMIPGEYRTSNTLQLINGDWLYFYSWRLVKSSPHTSSYCASLYRAKIDGSKTELVNEDSSESISSYGDYVIFTTAKEVEYPLKADYNYHPVKINSKTGRIYHYKKESIYSRITSDCGKGWLCTEEYDGYSALKGYYKVDVNFRNLIPVEAKYFR